MVPSFLIQPKFRFLVSDHVIVWLTSLKHIYFRLGKLKEKYPLVKFLHKREICWCITTDSVLILSTNTVYLTCAGLIIFL